MKRISHKLTLKKVEKDIFRKCFRVHQSKKGSIVYVGATRNPQKRAKQHEKRYKGIFYHMEAENMQITETNLIDLCASNNLKLYNKTDRSNMEWATSGHVYIIIHQTELQEVSSLSEGYSDSDSNYGEPEADSSYKPKEDLEESHSDDPYPSTSEKSINDNEDSEGSSSDSDSGCSSVKETDESTPSASEESIGDNEDSEGSSGDSDSSCSSVTVIDHEKFDSESRGKKGDDQANKMILRKRKEPSTTLPAITNSDNQVKKRSKVSEEKQSLMATHSLNGDLTEPINDETRCIRCQESIKNPNPESTWGIYTVCPSCIEELKDIPQHSQPDKSIKTDNNVKRTDFICEVCEVTSAVDVYCNDCTQFLCFLCDRTHRKIKTCADHTVISVDEKVVQLNGEICEKLKILETQKNIIHCKIKDVVEKEQNVTLAKEKQLYGVEKICQLYHKQIDKFQAFLNRTILDANDSILETLKNEREILQLCEKELSLK